MTSFYLSVRRNLTVVLLMLSLAAWAQERTVSGKVTSSEDGAAVPGANVLEKGTSNGTTTDMDGNFKISVSSGDAILSFTFIGFVSQEVTVGNQTTINIGLQSDITTLSEVVITGYGQQEKRDVTGVVTEVKATNFNKGAIISPDQLIAGKIAGVQITPNSGEPGTGGTVRIRGGTSITASNDPLYVVDGIPLDISSVPGARNPLNFINPNDIESFVVLKDASAAAIYGSRGANGVIMITTKRGKAGETKVTYDGFYSTSEISKKLSVLDGPQFREVVDLYYPSETSKLYDYNLVETATLKKTNTNWQDQLLRSAVSQSHNISFSGGNENTLVRASLGYQDQEGIIKPSSSRRTSFALNLNQRLIEEKLKIEAHMKGSETKDIFTDGGTMYGLYSMAPSQPVYDTAALPLYGGYWEWANVPLGTKNPVANNMMTQNQGVVYRGLGNIRFDYKMDDLVPGLRADLNLGMDITSGLRNYFAPTNLRAQAVQSFPGTAQAENTLRINKLLEFVVNYQKNISSADAKLDVTAGYSWQNFNTARNGYTGNGLTDNSFGFYNPAVATGQRIIYADYRENRLISFFGRINYSMKDKYLLTVNLRNDGSTRFGPAVRWGFFPSAAVGWRIYDEDFFAGLQDVFSDMKIRVGYGITGNQEIPDYRYLPVFSPTNGLAEYPIGSPIRPNAVDPNLKWEETSSLNFGVDFGLLKGRLTGSIEYYNKDTKDLLFVKNVPAGTLTGDKVLTNIGKVNNQGFELTLNATVINQTDLHWDVGFNFSMNRNEVIALDGVDDPKFQGYETGGISGGLGNSVQIFKVGYPVNTFRLYQHKTGADGKPLQDGVDWNNDGVVGLADMYEDANGDGTVNDQDRLPDALAYPQPKAFLGLTSNLTWKSFDFTFTLRSNLGGQVYNNVLSSNGYLNRLFELVPNNVPTAALEANFRAPQYTSNYYLEDATFIRCDNITLGYTVNKLTAAKIRVYATVQNAFVWTKYSGLDPEVVNGIDNNLYPRSRTIVFGLSVGF